MESKQSRRPSSYLWIVILTEQAPLTDDKLFLDCFLDQLSLLAADIDV